MTRKSTATLDKKRIFIVDDHPMMRQGLAQLIGMEPDLETCGEAENAERALTGISAVKPDLVLVDISLPGRNGLELIKDFQAIWPNLPVLVVSMHDESLYAGRVLSAGGRGYIMKQEGGRKLMLAIRQVLAGKIFLSEKMSAEILETLASHHNGGGSLVETLTDREFEIFQLIGQGQSPRDIAGKLQLNLKTVETHRANLKAKLKSKSVSELIRFAVRWQESQG